MQRSDSVEQLLRYYDGLATTDDVVWLKIRLKVEMDTSS